MKKPLIVSLILGLLMVSSSVLTMVMTPSADIADPHQQINLETLIPVEFGNWKTDMTVASLLVNPDEKGTINKIYNQTLSRTYINNQGERVMLSIAYGRDQKKDLQVHRPEICYRTSGFSIGELTKTFVDTTIGRIPVMQLVAKQGVRNEPITYWIRMGDSLTRGWFEQKAATLSYGLTGKVPDGLLFRVSTISKDEQDAYLIQQTFLTALLQAVRSEDRHWLVGRLALTR
ncbi:MAG: EpsI family protein [Gallionellaceae bacterium]|nr:EpsI family protein [Gallionellaceae bacterium]